MGKIGEVKDMKKKKYNTNDQNVWFTSDEHYGHKNIIDFCNRPFGSVHEMNKLLMENHNSVVSPKDIVFHLGDFSLVNDTEKVYRDYIDRLNGIHYFLRGSHDKWLKDKNAPYVIEMVVNGQHIVISHYAMRTWPRSHWNTWHLFGHSHGGVPPYGKSFDVGVDCTDYFPLDFQGVCDKMASLDDNFNLVRK